MRADDLHKAVGRIARILETAEIRPAVDGFRASRGDDRTIAAARLGHAGALVAERFQSLDSTGVLVLRSLHLDELARLEYWQQLIVNAAKPGPGAGEIVKLGVRLMFAKQNLPGLTRLLAVTDSSSHSRSPVHDGEARLMTRLTDAGERACDPDRVARSIDGIDMLYSACASIARRPAIDLRLDGIDGDVERVLHFTGGHDAIKAVSAVLESIPGALADLDAEAEIDLDAIVESLPVFGDLQRLASLGSFSDADLKDISETMHQGALLVLESGILLVAPTPAASGSGASIVVSGPQPDDDEPPTLKSRPQPGGNASAAVSDRHYDEYLRERAAMQRDGSSSAPSSRANGQARSSMDTPTLSNAELSQASITEPVSQDRARKDAVEELLKSLGKARDD